VLVLELTQHELPDCGRRNAIGFLRSPPLRPSLPLRIMPEQVDRPKHKVQAVPCQASSSSPPAVWCGCPLLGRGTRRQTAHPQNGVIHSGPSPNPIAGCSGITQRRMTATAPFPPRSGTRCHTTVTNTPAQCVAAAVAKPAAASDAAPLVACCYHLHDFTLRRCSNDMYGCEKNASASCLADITVTKSADKYDLSSDHCFDRCRDRADAGVAIFALRLTRDTLDKTRYKLQSELAPCILMWT
jgi:hypothetical protein